MDFESFDIAPPANTLETANDHACQDVFQAMVNTGSPTSTGTNTFNLIPEICGNNPKIAEMCSNLLNFAEFCRNLPEFSENSGISREFPGIFPGIFLRNSRKFPESPEIAAVPKIFTVGLLDPSKPAGGFFK